MPRTILSKEIDAYWSFRAIIDYTEELNDRGLAEVTVSIHYSYGSDEKVLKWARSMRVWQNMPSIQKCINEATEHLKQHGPPGLPGEVTLPELLESLHEFYVFTYEELVRMSLNMIYYAFPEVDKKVFLEWVNLKVTDEIMES